MESLTAKDITAIIARGGYKKQKALPKNHYYVRVPGIAPGTTMIVRFSGKPASDMVGKFEGKKGTATRSRKGRTSIKANGSRQYIIAPESQVVAYKVAQ